MEEKKLDKDINVRSKLPDEEIVKALECCTVDEVTDCENCPLLRESCAIIRKYALELINRQKAEIERLTEELKNCGQELIDSHREQEELQDRNAELRKQVEKLKEDCNYQVHRALVAEGKVETMKKQVDELKNRFENKAYCNMSENCSMVQQAVKDTAKKYHDAVKKMFDDADCCGWIEDSETKYWHEDNNKIAREQFGVEVE